MLYTVKENSVPKVENRTNPAEKARLFSCKITLDPDTMSSDILMPDP